MPTLATYGDGVTTTFLLPVHNQQATATVAGSGASLASQGPASVTFASAPALNAAVVISYNPVYKGSSRSVVYATKTSALSLPNNATTGITGWTAGLDTNSNFDVTTGTFTAPAAGNYLVSAQVCSAYGSVAAGAIFALLVLANSATVAAGESGFTTAGTTDMCAQTTVLAPLAAGQTITVSVYHTSGAAINTASGAGKNYLSITQLP